MTSKKAMVLVTIGLLLFVGIAAAGQQAPEPQGEKVRLLLVDETKTFSSTMRVGIFAGILKKNKMFDVTVKMVDVKTSYADPLAGEEAPPARYDVIVIVPKGIDDGSVSQVWIVTRGLGELSPGAKQGVKMLTALVDKVFVGLATAVGVSDDLYPGFLSALYVAEGWL